MADKGPSPAVTFLVPVRTAVRGGVLVLGGEPRGGSGLARAAPYLNLFPRAPRRVPREQLWIASATPNLGLRLAR